MKRYAVYIACALGLALFFAVLPLFSPPLPRGLSVTREEARKIADAEAVRIGIPVDKSWAVMTWESAPIIEEQLYGKPELRIKAEDDPVVGPRLGGYRVTYFRLGTDKFPEYGHVILAKDGRPVGARRRARNEEIAANPTQEQLRPVADQIIRSQLFTAAPNPEFESARPTVQRARTDHMFRYKVPTKFPSGKVSYYLGIYFIGDKYAGYQTIEEYSDGSAFRFGIGEAVAGTFARYAVIYILLLILLITFLKKYHAGEVGVGVGALLFAGTVAIFILIDIFNWKAMTLGIGFGSMDARNTALTYTIFRFLFYDLPVAVLVFLGWSVGESFARERWGEKLASFDAILRRDAINATVGRSLLTGLLAAPAVAAVALAIGAIPVLAGWAYPILGTARELFLLSGNGEAAGVVAAAAGDAVTASVVAFLFLLAWFHRRRLLPLGFIVACVVGVLVGAFEVPITPATPQLVFGLGGVAAAAVVFLAFDLLAASTAIFCGSLFLTLVPFLTVVSGAPAMGAMAGLAVPYGVILLFAISGLWTRREIVYEYEDLAPHVRRIVERERVKAEIDAANRIQAALLPSCAPKLEGASVSSHYRAATEIGGDYFDFLPLPGEKIGLAFGDVSGHGLTSGIIMAMAKAALLVQVDYDPSPTRVMEVLNEVVLKTAPRRMLMTFFFGILDAEESRLRFSSAGHHDPYVYRAKSGKIEALSAWGFPLGVKRREPFSEHTVTFEAGDRLILYSDGLIEAVDDEGEPFGFDRFEHAIIEAGAGTADDIKKALLQSVKKFTRNRPPEDDQTLVVISFDATARMQRSA